MPVHTLCPDLTVVFQQSHTHFPKKPVQPTFDNILCPLFPLNLPLRVQASIKHNNSARILFFPLTRFGSRKFSLLLFPAFSFHSIHLILVSLYSFNINIFFDHKPTAIPHNFWFSKSFFWFINQQHYRAVSGFSQILFNFSPGDSI